MSTAHHKKEWSDIHEFFRNAEDDNDAAMLQVGRLFKEYVGEASHSGWDGFSSRDVTGIRRFLTDYIIYFKGEQNDK